MIDLSGAALPPAGWDVCLDEFISVTLKVSSHGAPLVAMEMRSNKVCVCLTNYKSSKTTVQPAARRHLSHDRLMLSGR